ncbi:MAG: hypothetical protein N2504_03615 [candidate division WOR-3 bacterium]|nr:hypothetical protein [candidate division WOR-3 bacterium]
MNGIYISGLKNLRKIRDIAKNINVSFKGKKRPIAKLMDMKKI